MLPSTSQHCCGLGRWRPSNTISCSGSWRRTRRSSTPTLTRKPKSFSTEKNNGFSDMTRRQQGLWASCHSCRACPCASPRPCPNSNPGACSRTPADSCLGGPAAGAGAPKNAGMPLCLDPRRNLATPPRSSTGGRLHSPGCATLEARSARHRHCRQTRFSAGLRLCRHGAFVYGRHISCLQFGLRILGYRGQPGLIAQCIHVPVPR